ncbi:unnamed protein product [Schistosoma margrebowiei]|uniref:Uncharacterized protein n=1 Tax=Schistosoma margrebowiei TaxID=48269 RepID=A0A183MAZ9_9TREM|nr:unnamed protein product [Schistosoma margrebowiei]
MGMKKAISSTCHEFLSHKKHHHKEWITVDTLDKNQGRKSMMAAMNNSRKRAVKVKSQAEYTEVIKQVKRSIRTDKRKYVEDLAVMAGKTVGEGNMRSERSVKSKEDKTSTSEEKRGMHWASRMPLDDIDFADDLALPSQSQKQMQD